MLKRGGRSSSCSRQNPRSWNWQFQLQRSNFSPEVPRPPRLSSSFRHSLHSNRCHFSLRFLWCLSCHSKCKYWMLPSTWVSLSVISHEQKKDSILFYSILFYSILFYSILAALFMCLHSFRWKLTQNVAGLTLLCSYNFRFTGTFLLKRKLVKNMINNQNLEWFCICLF